MPFAPVVTTVPAAAGGRDGTTDFVRVLRMLNQQQQQPDALPGYDQAAEELAKMFGVTAPATDAAAAAATDSFD